MGLIQDILLKYIYHGTSSWSRDALTNAGLLAPLTGQWLRLVSMLLIWCSEYLERWNVVWHLVGSVITEKQKFSNDKNDIQDVADTVLKQYCTDFSLYKTVADILSRFTIHIRIVIVIFLSRCHYALYAQAEFCSRGVLPLLNMNDTE